MSTKEYFRHVFPVDFACTHLFLRVQAFCVYPVIIIAWLTGAASALPGHPVKIPLLYANMVEAWTATERTRLDAADWTSESLLERIHL